MPAEAKRPYEEKTASVLGLSLAPGVAAKQASVGPPIMGAPVATVPGAAVGAPGGELLGLDGMGNGGLPAGVPPQWARDNQQQQQMAQVDGKMSGGDFELLNSMARMGLMGAPGNGSQHLTDASALDAARRAGQQVGHNALGAGGFGGFPGFGAFPGMGGYPGFGGLSMGPFGAFGGGSAAQGDGAGGAMEDRWRMPAHPQQMQQMMMQQQMGMRGPPPQAQNAQQGQQTPGAPDFVGFAGGEGGSGGGKGAGGGSGLLGEAPGGQVGGFGGLPQGLNVQQQQQLRQSALNLQQQQQQQLRHMMQHLQGHPSKGPQMQPHMQGQPMPQAHFFSKFLYIVKLYNRYTRALTFEHGQSVPQSQQLLLQQNQQEQQRQQQQRQQQQQQQQRQQQPPHGRGVAGSVALKETATQVLKDKFTQARINAVSEGIWNIFTELVPQDDIMQSRQLLCNKLQRLIQTRWPRTQLQLYGSSGNNLCSKDSAQILKKYCSVVTS